MTYRVTVHHTLDGLFDDIKALPVKFAAEVPGIVKKNVEAGNRIAQGFARERSGPHGRLYYKRLSAEMTSPTSGEYGPTGDVEGNAVGAGWRTGGPNLDLPNSADLIGPRLAKDVSDLADRLFW